MITIFRLIKWIFRLFIIILILLGLSTFIYPLRYVDKIRYYSEAYDVDPRLVMAIINVESKFKADAESHAGAKGLMQITPETSRWIYKNLYNREAPEKIDLFDPSTNIEFGVWFLSWLGKEFKGNTDLVVAAYNAGHGSVNGWLEDENIFKNGIDTNKIPFDETKTYVSKVKKNYKYYSTVLKADENDETHLIEKYLSFCTGINIKIRDVIMKSKVFDGVYNKISKIFL